MLPKQQSRNGPSVRCLRCCVADCQARLRRRRARGDRKARLPATLLKIYVYGYLNRVQSSRRLERECQRNIELVWLTGRLMPDFKTIADSARTMARPSVRS